MLNEILSEIVSDDLKNVPKNIIQKMIKEQILLIISLFSNATKHKKVRRKKEEEYLRKIRKDVILKLQTTCFLEISTFIPYATLEHRNKKLY